jgi:predicted DNA-binding transcriptional regulator AlpA
MAQEELLGLADIARELGVSKKTAQNYIARGDFPEPLGRIAAGPVWRKRHVDRWAKRTLPLPQGRPPNN